MKQIDDRLWADLVSYFIIGDKSHEDDIKAQIQAKIEAIARHNAYTQRIKNAQDSQ